MTQMTPRKTLPKLVVAVSHNKIWSAY